MIIDSIENIALYKGLSVNMAKAINYIIENNINELPLGQHAIADDDIFILLNEYETKAESDCVTESHKKYIDIQIMLSGVEKFGFAPLNGQTIVEPYNQDKDYIFYKADLAYQTLHKGSFAIFFPTDLHCPAIKANDAEMVKKAIVKVKV